MWRPVSIVLGVLSVTAAQAQIWHGEVGDVAALEAAAGQGDGDAIAELAWYQCYSLGGLRYDPIEVPDAWRRASSKGAALGKVGVAYDYYWATRWIGEKGAGWTYVKDALKLKPDHPLVKTVAAMFYEKGYGVERDEALALKLYREAWEAGNPLAGYRLMRCYQEGWSGLRKDGRRATELAHELSTKYQFMDAAVDLLDNVEKADDKQAVATAASLRRMILKAALRGDPSAQFRMAWVHRRDEDWEMALRFYELAARNDHYTAGSNLLNRFTFPIGRDNPNLLRAPYDQLHGMARKNYEEGGQDSGTHRLAGRDYRDRISGEEPMFARAEQIFVQQIQAGKLSMHFELGHLYCGNFEGKHPNMHRPELGLAHLLGNANIGANAPSMLAEVYAGEISKDIPVDLPKAYASMARANEVSPNKWPPSKVEKLVARMNFDLLAEAEKLISDGFPHALKHRNEAIDMLIEYGQWREGRERR